MKEKNITKKKRNYLFLFLRLAVLVLAFGYLSYVYIYQPYELAQVKVNTVADDPATPENVVAVDNTDRSKFEANF